MIRKVLQSLLIVFMIFSLCSCGNTTKTNTATTEAHSTETTLQRETASETTLTGNTVQHETLTETTSENEIGTRSNPYQIGDTIELDIKPFFADIDEKYKDVSLHLTLTINQSYTVEEGLAMMSDNSWFNAIPAANVTFKLTGNYEDAMYSGDIFNLSVVDENMQTEYYTLETDTQDALFDIYTDAEYTANLFHSYDLDTKTGTEAKYYVLQYVDMDNKEQCIYISATSMSSEQENEQNVEESEENLSPEEKKYQAALLAEEEGYYTLAKDIFSDILDFQDSQEHYTAIASILSEYNGTYCGESPNGVPMYLYIEDGKIKKQIGKEYISEGYDDLWRYGTTENGSPLLAFSLSANRDFFIDSHWVSYHDADSWTIQKMDDGSYLVLATEGNISDLWDAFYEKISDSVN